MGTWQAGNVSWSSLQSVWSNAKVPDRSCLEDNLFQTLQSKDSLQFSQGLKCGAEVAKDFFGGFGEY